MSVVDKVKAKIDNALHKDNHSTTTTNTNTTHHQHPVGGAGGAGGAGYGSTNAGPHNSNVANKVDPRVDSDRDGSRNMGAATYGPGGAANPNTSTYGNQGTMTGNQGFSTNEGPHSSNLANKLDPRVDSDRDGSRNMGAATYGPGGAATTHGNQGFSTNANQGYSTNAGPHSSNVANKLDPRVDSDRDGSQNMGAANYGPGGAANPNTTYGNQGTTYGNQGTMSGNQGFSTTEGPHSSNLANKLDPRVDSDRDGSRNMGMAQTGPGAKYNASTGPASSTAGHYGSNLLNKLDPRVDSDASNNNVQGGVRAHDTHGHHHHNNNPNTVY